MGVININVRSNASKFSVSVDPENTSVASFKEQIAKEADVSAPCQRLIYRGRVLKDDHQLSFYGVMEDQTIHLVKGSVPAPGLSSPSVANAGVGTGSTAQATVTSTTQTPGDAQRGLLGSNLDASNPFWGTTLDGTGNGNAAMQRMQQQLMSNPDMMANIMNSPMMQNMLSDPETLQNLMMSNPQMQQVVENNPQLAHILNDPVVMQQTLEMMRNPNAMREMMRSQDLAMSQIENHPEGFNFLRRMYTDIQEPVMQASMNQAQNMQQGLDGTGSSGRTPTQPTGGPMPNPWATTPSTTTTPSLGGMAGSGGASGGLNGSGGLGSGGVGGDLTPWSMGGADMSTPNSQQMMEMMQDPMVQQLIHGFLTNSNNLDQMINSNPMLQQAVTANPQLRDQLPRMMQSMSNPDVLQAVMQMQNSMQTLHRAGLMPSVGPGGAVGLPGTAGAGQGSLASGGTGTPANGTGTGGASGGLDFSSLLGTGTGMTTTPQQPSVPTTNTPAATPLQNPEVQYSNQLAQLNAMGFSDQSANIRALVASQGNVNAAVERLISGNI